MRPSLTRGTGTSEFRSGAEKRERNAPQVLQDVLLPYSNSPPMKITVPLLASLLLASASCWSQLTAVQVASGTNHTCALTTQGAVKCWGTNSFGELGDGTGGQGNSPVSVSGLSGVASITAGQNGTCAITNAGGLTCWGPGYGPVPGAVPGLSSGVTEAGVGAAYACALVSGGVRCWGSNEFGQLGDGTTTDRSTPAPALGLEGGVKHLAVGNTHACALMNDGTVKCWGDNSRSQLGIDSSTSSFRTIAVTVNQISGAVLVIANAQQSCALVSTGAMLCWGVINVDVRGMDVSDIQSASPVSIGGLEDGVVSLGRGHFHNCAITVNGAPKCWGWNGQNQLGDGTTTYSYFLAVNVVSLSQGVRSVSGGAFHTCAVVSGGRVRCWGDNYSGQLGDGTNENRRDAPTYVLGFGDLGLSYQGLWWRAPAASESGWGVNIAHQGNVLFVTWFTYDEQGNGMWLVMSEGRRVDDASYNGVLYRTSGPAFSADPWNPSSVTRTEVGSATLTFNDRDNGTFTYRVNGVLQTKPITRLVYAAPVPVCTLGGTPGSPPNYQDLWWRSGGTESGWGVNLTHQGDVLFATWFTYDVGGNGMWLVMSEGRPSGPGAWSGKLYRTTGPAYNTGLWDPSQVKYTEVGAATFTFLGANDASFGYTVNGVSQAKPISRLSFAGPPSICK